MKTAAFLTVLAASLFHASAAPATPVEFLRDVRPIFEKHCYSCHGPEKHKSGFRLDIKGEALRGGDTGEPAIVPGKGAASPLIRFVSGLEEGMLMPSQGERLSAAEIDTLRRWIDEGAAWPDGVDTAVFIDKLNHWSFKPLRNDPVPPAASGNPIDGFIAAKLAENGLALSPEADRRTLIRRLSLVLHGLPPAPDEVEAFALDLRPGAYEALVDRLLASPRYGERWARHWLDVIAFGETDGFEVNTPRENAWPYRDYVIEAFNRDTPYPRFILEQLAGDAVNEPRGTAFLVATAALLPGQIGKDRESKLKARQDELNDMVANVGGAFLGLTLHCARCHDHKFDPVPQKDYYALQAVFAGVRHGERPMPPSDWDDRKKREPALRAQLAAAAERMLAFEPLGEVTATSPRRQRPAHLQGAELAAWETAHGEFVTLERQLREIAEPPKVYAGRFEKPPDVHLLSRGDPLQPREIATPGALSKIGPPLTLPSDASEQERRLALARWLADPENPLPARVLVNRVWHHHFGEGFVNTLNDFGGNGAKPSHPELLDWLARDFLAGGWSIKRLQRAIVLSATWRQASAPRPGALAKDAATRLLWRYPPRRLEAEGVRDSILAVSGKLDLRMGGPGFSAFAPNYNYVRVYDPKPDFGPDDWRRMIYMTKVRMAQDSTFGAFDCPDAGQAAPKRARSTTPLQALNLFNSPFVIQQADFFAERLQREVGDLPAAQIRRGFALAFQRAPAPTELDACERLIREHGLPTFCRVLLNANELIFIP